MPGFPFLFVSGEWTTCSFSCIVFFTLLSSSLFLSLLPLSLSSSLFLSLSLYLPLPLSPSYTTYHPVLHSLPPFFLSPSPSLPSSLRALHLAIIHNHQDVVLQLLDVLPQLPPTETPVVDCLNNHKQVFVGLRHLYVRKRWYSGEIPTPLCGRHLYSVTVSRSFHYAHIAST